MGSQQTIPMAGVMLALVAFVALVLLGIDLVIAISILVLWIGSLLVISARPPDMPTTDRSRNFSPDSMRDLIENSSTPVIVTDKNKIAIANHAARTVLGQHMVGQDARVVFRQPEVVSLLGQDRNGQAIARGLVRRHDIWRINRQQLDENLSVMELTNQTAEADISRAHTDFVANASHELRTPLASILGYVETLRESGDSLDSPTSQKFLGTIEREGQRLQSLISDLMSLSRVEAEKHDRPESQIALRGLIETAARDAAGPDRIGRIEFDLADDLSVRGDEQQIEQVIRNLVDNALKYGGEDTPVRITLDQSRNREARITVEDKGEGVSPEHIPHLTRRFYRTDPGRSRASGGTGLGLAIVKHIVERHRGRLDITSKLGAGTTVIVRIPLAEQK